MICCCCWVTKLCLTLCDPMDCSTPGLAIPHHLLEFAQVHVHLISDAIQPSHPLSLSVFPNIRVFSNELTFHIRWQSIEASASTSVLLMSIQCWFPLGLIGLIALLSKGLSSVFSSTTLQKHQFFSAQSSVWSNSHICTWLLEKVENFG